MSDINTFIPSFGDFMVYCKESGIERELFEEIFRLYDNYIKLEAKLEVAWDSLKDKRPKNITPKEKKKFAMSVFELINKEGLKDYSGMFFGMNDGKIESVQEYMMKYDNKKLYKAL